MSLLVKPICLQAKARVSPDAAVSANVNLGLIRSALPAALNSFGFKTSLGPQRRLLQKEFTGTISGRSIDLGPFVNAAEPLLLPFDAMSQNYIPFEAVNTNEGRAVFISDKGHLDIQQLDDGNVYYAIQSRTLWFNAQTMPTGSVTIIGNFTPAITTVDDVEALVNVPTEFNDDIVAELLATYLMQQKAA